MQSHARREICDSKVQTSGGKRKTEIQGLSIHLRKRDEHETRTSQAERGKRRRIELR